MFKHPLVPTDGSPLSQEAVLRAVSFASEAGARITFFCAIQPSPKMYYGMGSIFDAHMPTTFRESMRSTAQDILDAAEQLALATGVECRKVMLFSEEPYAAIIEAARHNECDLIFMASHGRRGVKGFVLGSETRKGVTHSTIPVLGIDAIHHSCSGTPQ
jgi:nucleotide-binding universal stress UspA family protein